MADGSTIPPAAAGRSCAPDAVWAAVRDDYLAGVSAPECCRRHGVGLTTLRARAAAGGWRRADLPWTPRNALDPADEGVALEVRVGGDLDKIDLGQGRFAFVAAREVAAGGSASGPPAFDDVYLRAPPTLDVKAAAMATKADKVKITGEASDTEKLVPPENWRFS